jgi:hypothetical protein
MKGYGAEASLWGNVGPHGGDTQGNIDNVLDAGNAKAGPKRAPVALENRASPCLMEESGLGIGGREWSVAPGAAIRMAEATLP